MTRIEVHKADRKMYLLHNDRGAEVYDIELGFNPVGHKQFEGDGKTPEGRYCISHKNPAADYHLSLGISYPNENDVAFAEADGQSRPAATSSSTATPSYQRQDKDDWTAGCIAVTDNARWKRSMRWCKPGTPILILP